MRRFVFIVCCSTLACGCSHPKDKLFSSLPSSETGIDFSNTIRETTDANVLNYAYFYNGAGVAIGDINNDGLPDVLFTGNMVPNRLYLNKGNFSFEDITATSGVAGKQGWCTGATMADVNGDGLLDIYICRSGDSDPERRRNLLYINDGNGRFTESAHAYGLDDAGYSTQAVFFDYDRDGDLDMFLVNHSLQQYASGNETTAMRRQQNPAFADKLFRNDNGHFTDVSKTAGIYSNVLTFGLGVAVSDFNNDGWPDVYVSNDFNEPDYLFINNGNGGFTENLRNCMDQVSLYSMGCDAADINNDGRTDLITLDMLPEDNWSQKMHTGAENFDKFQLLFRQGIFPQYSRNMLHLNNGDGTFSEIGQLAGISNTDWSWSALLADFDNDGNKDLYISNGYAKDNTNMDFVKYRINQQMRARQGGNSAEIMKDLIDKMPSMPLSSYLFQNDGSAGFINRTAAWGMGGQGVASGAAYADLDGDGALDLVVNNINSPATVFRNNARRLLPANHFLTIRLRGNKQNTFGIGARVSVHCLGKEFLQEVFTTRGFQSSVSPVLNFGLGETSHVDSIIIRWADGIITRVKGVKSDSQVLMAESDATNQIAASVRAESAPLFSRIPGSLFIQKENETNDFAVQPLLPSFLSHTGPCMAKADVNGDGLEDIFVGGAAGHPGIVALQSGQALKMQTEPAISKDSSSGQTAAVFFDADGDGDADLFIAGGGYAAAQGSPAQQDHLYLNDGKGHFTASTAALPPLSMNKQCVLAADIDCDGDQDIFLGGSVVPGQYPRADHAIILLNNGRGKFSVAGGAEWNWLDSLGLVTDAVFTDLNKDGHPDLIVAGTWMPIRIFINEKGVFRERTHQYIPFATGGWWNKIVAGDFDGDGNTDLIVGNQGLNNQFTATEKQPVTLYTKDFDGNGIPDPLMFYYIHDSAYPVYARDDMMDQLPMLKKNMPEYHEYAHATLHDLFTAAQLSGAEIRSAPVMETIYLHNNGHGQFEKRPLPRETQYAPVYAIVAEDLNGDGRPDLVLGGNNAWARIKFGRYRANHGLVLINDGKGNFSAVPAATSALQIRGDVRSMEFLKNKQRSVLLVGINDDSVRAYRLNPISIKKQNN